MKYSFVILLAVLLSKSHPSLANTHENPRIEILGSFSEVVIERSSKLNVRCERCTVDVASGSVLVRASSENLVSTDLVVIARGRSSAVAIIGDVFASTTISDGSIVQSTQGASKLHIGIPTQLGTLSLKGVFSRLTVTVPASGALSVRGRVDEGWVESADGADLQLTGAGNLAVGKLTGGTLSVRLTGSHTVSVADANDLAADIRSTGNGSVKVGGSLTSLRAKLVGNSTLEVEHVQTLPEIAQVGSPTIKFDR